MNETFLGDFEVMVDFEIIDDFEIMVDFEIMGVWVWVTLKTHPYFHLHFCNPVMFSSALL